MYGNIDKTITSYSWPLLGKTWTNRTNSFKRKVFKGSDPMVFTDQAGCYKAGRVYYTEDSCRSTMISAELLGHCRPCSASFLCKGRGRDANPSLLFIALFSSFLQVKCRIFSGFDKIVSNSISAFISGNSKWLKNSCGLPQMRILCTIFLISWWRHFYFLGLKTSNRFHPSTFHW